MNRVVLRGPGAEVRWGYRRAAVLGPWTLTSEPSGTSVTASIATVDAFAASQQPLTFVVPRPNGQPWRWAVQSLQIADTTLTASLGAQE